VDAPSERIRIENLPPAPRRPVQWRRAWQSLELLREGKPENALVGAYGVKDSLGGLTDEHLLRRVAATPSGQAILQRRDSLPDLLADHARLAAMPDGSFGRAYLAFARRHGLNARKLVEAEHEMSRDYGRLDPLRQWFCDRLTVLHDLWHVLAGYDATQPGESAIVCFSMPQGLWYRPMPIFVITLLLQRHLGLRSVIRAFRRGARAEFLPALDYAELLPLPLPEVRRRLRLPPPIEDHCEAIPQLLIPEPAT
jgi:ubiquinone biosynthesis protein COQ4